MTPQDYITKGLIQRGLPAHVAQGFVMNMQDESGLNSGINEASPLVHGSRGGFGLYQLTGPRRRAYEAYASNRGIALDSADAQLDFLMTELQGPEKNAAKSIFSTNTPQEAAAAIARDFLRPSDSNLKRRIASYTGGILAPTQVAETESKMTPEEEPRGLLGSLGIQKMEEGAEGEAGQRFFQRDTFKDTAAQLAPLLASMGSSPALQKATAGIAAQRTEAKAKNKTIEFLKGLPNGEELVRIAQVAGPQAAMKYHLDSRKAPKDTRTSGLKDYAKAQSQGYEGTFIEYQSEVSGKGAGGYSPIGKLRADLDANRITQEQFDAATASKGGEATTAEDKIARLESTGVPRNIAIAIVDNRYDIVNDEVTGQTFVFDKATGQKVNYKGEEGNAAPETLTETSVEPAVEPAVEPGSMDGTDPTKATGFTGFANSWLNTVSDAFGLDLPAPEAAEASANMRSLATKTIALADTEFAGKPTNFLRERVEENFSIKPDQISMGPQIALERSNVIIKMLQETVNGANAAISGATATIGARRKALDTLPKVKTLLRDYISLRDSLSQGINPTAGFSMSESQQNLIDFYAPKAGE